MTLSTSKSPVLILLIMISYYSVLSQPLQFKKFQKEHFVTTIFQDHLGFLWLGTPAGIFRYDGHHFKNFQYDQADSLTLSDNAVWNIEEDKEGYLWIGTNKGLNRLNPKREIVRRIKADLSQIDSLTHHQIMDLLVDTAGTVWVATANGLNRYLKQGQRFQRYLYEPRPTIKHPLRTCRSPIQTDKGTIWLGLRDTLYRYEETTDRFKGIRLPGNLEDINSIRLIYEDDEGFLWIGTQLNGLFRFDPHQSIFFEHYTNEPNNSNSLSHNKVSALIENGNELWIGTTGGGLNVLNRTTKNITRYTGNSPDPFSVNSVTIRDAWEDNRGNIWLGSFYDGLYQFKKSQRIFKNFDQNTGLLAKKVNDIEETTDGKIWVAMGTGGLGVFDSHENRFSNYYQYDPKHPNRLPAGDLKRLHKDYNGQLWVASGTEGISRFDTASDRFKKYLPSRLEDLSYFDFLTDFFVETNGDIWIALQTGLVKYDAATQSYKQYSMPDKPNSKINYGDNNFVTSIYKDRQQQLWFTTYGGINLYLPETDSFEFFPSQHLVQCLLEDSKGTLWIGANYGPFLFDQEKKVFSNSPNVSMVTPLLEDKSERIWFFNSAYILRYDLTSKQKIRLNHQDGLIKGFYWTGHLSETGNLLLGGPDGLTVFHPDSIQKIHQPPRVVLTDFRLFNQPVPLQRSRGDTLSWKSPLSQSITFTENISLHYWQNYFSLEFAALDFTAPENNRYRYQLVGYDQSWVETDAQHRLVTYTNLDPGIYTFRVQGAVRNGPWNEAGATLQIRILSPWWQTWWAYLLWMGLLAGLIYIFYRFQLSRRLAEAEASKVKALDEVKTRLYTNITHEFRTPLTVILGLADEIQTVSQKQIIAIKRNSQQLLQLVNQMLALSKLESGKEKLEMRQGDIFAFVKYVIESFQSYAVEQNVDLKLSSNKDKLIMDYDAKKLQLILSNLIANAIKFTPAGGNVKTTLTQIKQQLHINISDTGEGIALEQLPYIFDRYYQADSLQENTGSGIGLTLVKEYVHMLEGKIEVESELGKGTTFYIQLPINQQATIASTLPPKLSSIPVETTSPIVASKVSLVERPKLLLVEDNKDVLQYLSLFLKNHYDLQFAYDGLEGVRKAIAEIPDLIISDVMMPRKNGFELCEQIKKDERTSHIPIILLTAKADFDSKIEGLELGADVYLSKPFQKQELLIQITRLLEQRKTLQAHFSQLAMLPTDRYQVKKGEESFLYRVQSTLEANLDNENFDIAALSEALYLSRMHLHRKLKALTGQTTSQYIAALRLKRSKDLLKQPELSISEIAYKVGFKSQSHFSQVFTREIGKPPSAWRKEVDKS